MDILIYRTRSGRFPFREWLDGLDDITGRIALQRRLDRFAAGNPGDHKLCRDGVWELRIDTGPGYRVYFGKVGVAVVVVLSGGDKRSQNPDIARAVRALRDFRSRSS